MACKTTCRLCLSEVGSFVNVFEFNKDWTPAEVIYELLRFEVYPDDIYPQSICNVCSDVLNNFKKFKLRCEACKESLECEHDSKCISASPESGFEEYPSFEEDDFRLFLEDDDEEPKDKASEAEEVFQEVLKSTSMIVDPELARAETGSSEHRKKECDVDIQPLPKEGLSFSCSECSHSYTTLEYLQEHRIMTHGVMVCLVPAESAPLGSPQGSEIRVVPPGIDGQEYRKSFPTWIIDPSHLPLGCQPPVKRLSNPSVAPNIGSNTAKVIPLCDESSDEDTSGSDSIYNDERKETFVRTPNARSGKLDSLHQDTIDWEQEFGNYSEDWDVPPGRSPRRSEVGSIDKVRSGISDVPSCSNAGSFRGISGMLSRNPENVDLVDSVGYLRVCGPSDEKMGDVGRISETATENIVYDSDANGSSCEIRRRMMGIMEKSNISRRGEAVDGDVGISVDDTDKLQSNNLGKCLQGNSPPDEDDDVRIIEEHLVDKPQTRVGKVSKESPSKSFICAHCETSFSELETLKVHLCRHDGDKRYVCGECGLCFNKLRGLRSHSPKHENEIHECTMCLKAFKRVSTLNRHVAMHCGRRPHQCLKCKARFSTKPNLKEHVTRCDGGIHPYVCQHCKLSFKHSSTLRRHARTHALSGPFLCEVCNKEFNSNGELMEHLRLHANVTQFKCATCGKCFYNLLNLKTHLMLHCGRTYMCDICDRSFRHYDTYENHLLIHFGVQNFECMICNKTFMFKTRLNEHLKSHRLIENVIDS